MYMAHIPVANLRLGRALLLLASEYNAQELLRLPPA